MRTAVEDVELGQRQDTAVDSAHVPIQRQLLGSSSRPRHGEADPEQGVGPEVGFVRGAVRFDQAPVHLALVECVDSEEQRTEDLIHVGHRLGHPTAAESVVISVPEFNRFVDAGRRPRRHRRPAHLAAGQRDLDFQRRVAPGIQDLAGQHLLDEGQPLSP